MRGKNQLTLLEKENAPALDEGRQSNKMQLPLSRKLST